MKAKIDDPNKKPSQIQKITQLPSEKRSSGVAWSAQMLDTLKSHAAPKINKTDRLLEPNQPEASFLAMVQGQSFHDPEILIENQGTISRTKPLKECSQEIKSEFEIEFKELGRAGVKVVQLGDEYLIALDMQDKSKIPKNPLLFRRLIEKQLSDQLGVNFRIQVS